MGDKSAISIHVLHCGSISVSARVPNGGEGLYNAAAELLEREERRVDLPVSAYLIEHPRGLILVDTGWSRELSPRGLYDRNAVRRQLPGALAAFYRPSLPPGSSAREQLEARGIRPEDLDLVLLSHLDPDHVSGLRDLKGAKRILMAEEERWWTARGVYKLRQPPGLWDWARPEVFWYKGVPYGPNRWAYDLFGDGSIALVNLPGHTEGMFGLMIKGGDKFLILCSDAAFRRENVEKLQPPGFGFSRRSQERSLKWLREMSRDPACAGIIANHDPEQRPGTIVV